MASLRDAEEHNARLFEERGKPSPKNIKPENNGKLGYNDYAQLMEGKDLQDAIEKRLRELKIKPKDNAVIAHEYVLGVSKDWYKKANYDPQGMLSNLVVFAAEKYGSENIASVAFHFDESNPHAHIIVLPIVEKERKWKNRHGAGSKVEKGLSGSDFIGGRDTLTQLQTDYYEFVSKYNRNDGIIRRGLKVEDQKKEYTQKTNHLFDEMKDLQIEIKETLDLIKKGENLDINITKLQEQQTQLNSLSDEINENETDLAKAEKKLQFRKDQNRNGGWKKGLDF